jgi:hypothetical protein
LVTFSGTSKRFTTSFFSKEVHSGAILPFDSRVPLQRKINVLRTERLRAIRNCSTEAESRRAMIELSEKFKSNGYPSYFLQRYFWLNKPLSQVTKRTNENEKKKYVYLKFPYINESFSRKVMASLRKADLPVVIRPVFKTSLPLNAQLRGTSSVQCGRECVCGSNNCCYTKNVVYLIVCNICSARYVGETFRTCRSRIIEHLKSDSSLVRQHFLRQHHGPPTVATISFSFVGRGFDSTLQRKARERELILSFGANINVQHGQ